MVVNITVIISITIQITVVVFFLISSMSSLVQGS